MNITQTRIRAIPALNRNSRKQARHIRCFQMIINELNTIDLVQRDLVELVSILAKAALVLKDSAALIFLNSNREEDFTSIKAGLGLILENFLEEVAEGGDVGHAKARTLQWIWKYRSRIRFSAWKRKYP